MRQLLAFYTLHPEQLTQDQLVAYVCHIKEDRNLSSSSMRIAISSIKYFYRNVIGRPSLVENIPYPKKEKHIRTILTGAEMLRLFKNTENIKHRLLLKLVYSAGLRRSEVVKVRPEDFDWRNKQLFVRQGKGRKDRYTVLAASLKYDFNKYMKQHSPQAFLFYGKDKKRPLSESATGWIMEQALKRATINKPGVCLHSLRHSFASHLLALRTDVVTVQKLMGHDDIRTTMDYFHLGNRPDSKPKSPLDTLYP
jgi:site-specific recombinase XerD